MAWNGWILLAIRWPVKHFLLRILRYSGVGVCGGVRGWRLRGIELFWWVREWGWSGWSGGACWWPGMALCGLRLGLWAASEVESSVCACTSPPEVCPAGKLQWHFTFGFDFRHDCHLRPLLQFWRGY